MKYLQGEQLSLIAEVEELARPVGDWYEEVRVHKLTHPNLNPNVTDRTSHRTPILTDRTSHRTPILTDRTSHRTPNFTEQTSEVDPKVREHNSIDALMHPNYPELGCIRPRQLGERTPRCRRQRPGKKITLPNSDLEVPFGTIEFKVIKDNAYYYWRYRETVRQKDKWLDVNRSIYLGHGKKAIDRLSIAIMEAKKQN